MECFGLFLARDIRYDIYNLEWLFGQLRSIRGDVRKLEAKWFISHFNVFLQNSDLNGLIWHTVLKSDHSRGFLVVNSRRSCVIWQIKLHGFIVDSDGAITAVLPEQNNINKIFTGESLDALGFLEGYLSGLIIVQNCNPGPAVASGKVVSCVWIFELNKEIFIRLPVIVVDDENFNL